MRAATIQDIQIELWLRERERSQIVWKTKDGEIIPINAMSETHIQNILKYYKRNELLQELACEYQAYLDDLD